MNLADMLKKNNDKVTVVAAGHIGKCQWGQDIGNIIEKNNRKQARDKKNKEAEKALRLVNPESTFKATTTGKGYIGGLNKGGKVKCGPIGRKKY